MEQMKEMTGSEWRGRRAARLARALGLVLAAALVAGIIAPAYAADGEMPPRLPHLFAGTVSTSSGPVPQGTVVQAYLDGVKRGETVVNEQSRYQMLVEGDYDDDGKLVTFMVGGVQASQTAPWASGDATYNFDLTIPSLPNDNGFPFPLPFDCFIATAAYATGAAEEINLLRQFRDVVLLESPAGTGLVSLYYRVSPAIAQVISQHGFLRTAVRVGLVEPIVAVLDWSHALWSEDY